MKKFWSFFFWALLLRTLCAYFVYGPQALDDYAHGLIPALHWFHNGVLDLPDYRSPLLIYTLRFWLEVGSWLSIDALVDQIRWLGWGLALIQMTGLYAVWKIFEKESSRAQTLALFLYSSFIIMPFVATRAFGEAVALPFVVIAFMFLMRPASFASIFAGFAFLGVATLYRFQVGLMGVVVLLMMLFQHRQKSRGGQPLMVLSSALAAGCVILLVQAMLDLSFHRPMLSTLVNYLRANEGGAAQYGVSPWYNTWFFPLLVFLFPFSWPIFTKESLVGLWKKWGLAVAAAFIFIFVHSLIPHKEERFLYPVLGLLLIFMAYLWAKKYQHFWVRKVLTPMMFLLHGVGVLLVVFSNSQEGVVEPLAMAEKSYAKFVALETKSLMQESELRSMFLVRGSQEMPVEQSQIGRVFLEKLFAEKDFDGVVWVTSDADVAALYRFMENTEEKNFHCGSVHKAASLMDSIIYKLNPKHNQRRRPSWYLMCGKSTEGSK